MDCKPAMTTLALDLGSTTGFAVRCKDGSVASGAWQILPTDRWLELWGLLSEINRAYGPAVIVIEAPTLYTRRLAPARVAFGLTAVVQMWAKSLGVEYREINIKTIKKVATGNGNADKDMMLEAAQRHFPDQKIYGYDHADALCVLYTYEQQRQ